MPHVAACFPIELEVCFYLPTHSGCCATHEAAEGCLSSARRQYVSVLLEAADERLLLGLGRVAPAVLALLLREPVSRYDVACHPI